MDGGYKIKFHIFILPAKFDFLTVHCYVGPPVRSCSLSAGVVGRGGEGDRPFGGPSIRRNKKPGAG